MGISQGGAPSQGGGLYFRSPADTFSGATKAAAEAKRDAYFGSADNAGALAQFQSDQNLAIIIRVNNAADSFETYLPGNVGNYDASKWEARTDAVRGPTGPEGPRGPAAEKTSLGVGAETAARALEGASVGWPSADDIYDVVAKPTGTAPRIRLTLPAGKALVSVHSDAADITRLFAVDENNALIFHSNIDFAHDTRLLVVTK